ncbi:MAG: 2-oxoacid:acceptor oxidoreductase subunit alpha [Anaerolineae bacterium]
MRGWKTVPNPLKPGHYFWLGDEACAEGAIATGCNFYAGYPITPSSEIMERIAHRFSEMNRLFIQMEDELASIAACIGASWAGAKAMTATSGPGLSLMLENIGYALITETPLVIVDVQRAGPSTGQATRPAQGDMMQARWGAHGDYEIIALSPWSVTEMYTETIRAFNLAERFRVPVLILADEAVGHLREGVKIDKEVRVYERKKGRGVAPFVGKDVPPMPAFGEGEKLLITGSTHDPRGFRRTVSPEAQKNLVGHLARKITDHQSEIIEVVEYHGQDEELDLLLVAYGFTARSALAAVEAAREEGLKAGLLRLKTIWPFPQEELSRVGQKAKRIIVPEMNLGQIVREVQRVLPQAEPYSRTDGQVITPQEIVSAF